MLRIVSHGYHEKVSIKNEIKKYRPPQYSELPDDQKGHGKLLHEPLLYRETILPNSPILYPEDVEGLNQDHLLIQLFSPQIVAKAIDSMAIKLARQGLGFENSRIVSIGKGGDVFATKLKLKLEMLTHTNVPLDSVRVNRTLGATLQEDIQVDPLDQRLFYNTNVILVDWLTDENKSLHAIRNRLGSIRNCFVTTAVLVNKVHEGKVPYEYPLLLGLACGNLWLGGEGGDVYDDVGRELDGIYVLSDNNSFIE